MTCFFCGLGPVIYSQVQNATALWTYESCEHCFKTKTRRIPFSLEIHANDDILISCAIPLGHDVSAPSPVEHVAPPADPVPAIGLIEYEPWRP